MAGSRIVDFPIGWGGLLTLNEHRDTSGVIDPTKVDDTILVDRFDFSTITFRDQRDGMHLLLGGDLGLVSSEFRFVSLLGKVLGSTGAKFEDKVAKFLGAFHPESDVLRSPTTRGVLPLDFYCPTEEVGYTSPVREVFYGRPVGIPSIFERRGDGLGAQFAAEIICPDTRRYLYTPESKACNSGNSWSIALPNWTTLMGADTAGVITLVLTGAGSSNCTLRYVDTAQAITTDLVLDLTGIGSGSHTIVIDMAKMTIKEGSTKKASLRTSAVDTFWRIGPGGGTFSVPTGRTNLTSATIAYRQARA